MFSDPRLAVLCAGVDAGLAVEIAAAWPRLDERGRCAVMRAYAMERMRQAVEWSPPPWLRQLALRRWREQGVAIGRPLLIGGDIGI